MRDEEEKVEKLTHELHMELSLANSSSFQSSIYGKSRYMRMLEVLMV